MTTLADVVIQHSGWSTPVFSTGGWDDYFPIGPVGATARSFWGGPTNGQATDFEANFVDAAHNPLGTAWVNQHISAPVQALTVPSPFVIPAGAQIRTYTRVPQSNLQIFARLVVSDQALTPPPVAPP
jgi:hypothetical protein